MKQEAEQLRKWDKKTFKIKIDSKKKQNVQTEKLNNLRNNYTEQQELRLKKY